MAKILVVDDWPLNREFLLTLLRYAGHDVTAAADGAAAFAALEAARPDLVITDIVMPIMDGPELARRMAQHPDFSGVPIIFYTATYRVPEAQSLAAQCGITTVLAKPSEPQQVLDAVHGELGLPLTRLEAKREVDGGALPYLSPPPTQTLQLAFHSELQNLRAAVETSVSEAAPPLNGEAHRLRQAVTRVDESFLLAQGLSMRLATLIELGIDLSQRENPSDLLAVFCRGARHVLSANFAVACLLDETGNANDVVASGFSAEQMLALQQRFAATEGIFGEVLRDGVVRVVTDAKNVAVGLPPAHPPVSNILVAPISSERRRLGWFYVAGHTGGAGFSADDPHLASILAAQLATPYERRLLLEQTKHHAALLEAEIDERRAAAKLLRESELKFRQLAENIRQVFFLLDSASGKVLYVSPAYAEVWQRSVESLYASPQSWLDAIHSDDRVGWDAAADEMAATGRFGAEYRIVRPDTSVRWIRARGFPIRAEDGRLYRVAGIAEDVTDVKLQDLRARRLSRILRMLSSINSAILRIHERGALLDETCRIAREEGEISIAWVAWRGTDGSAKVAASRGIDAVTIAAAEAYFDNGRFDQWPPALEAVRSKNAVFHQDLRQAPPGDIGPVARLAIEQGCPYAVSLPLLRGSGLVGFILLYAKDVEGFAAEQLALLGKLAGDVSFALQYIEKEEQLNYLAYYDPLTGLANASLFQERLAQMLDGKPRKAALFIVDIDRFTGLNDSLGRHIGDRLLIEVGTRLKAAVPEPSLFARVGADSFAVAVSALRTDSEAGSVLQERIMSQFNEPFMLEDREVRASVRAGVAVYPADGGDRETLFKNAEVALNGARAANARFMFYSPQLNARVADDLALEQELRGALERKEFRLYYQPKVAAKSGQLVGLEALLRWQRPQGVVPPDRFIRMLEDSELIIDVGRWVIVQALADFRAWRERGLNVPRIAVNVSPIQLRYADFPDMVLGELQRAGIEGQPLELEITESVIMADIEASTERLKRLNDSGVTIAIDDFGTGYSSLRYLAKLPVDTLKIDRSFVVRMSFESDSMTLVSTMISLAHAFALTVVAEGVESEEQANLLRLLKCDVLQGYLFGKPLPASEVEALLLN